jgi:hypothetical protein
MREIEIKLTKAELLRQIAVRDFWSDVAFQEGYEVARGYSFDDIEEEVFVEVQSPLETSPHWSIDDLSLGLRQAMLIPCPAQGCEWQTPVDLPVRQAA